MRRPVLRTLWTRTGLAAVMCCVVAALANAQPPDPPASPWTRAIDAYLTGRDDVVAATLRGVAPGELRVQARQAFDAWMARARAAAGGPKAVDERRLAIRRMQAAAALPLEIVSAISTRTRVSSAMDPYQEVAIDAWERLAEFEEMRLEGPGAPNRAEREAQRAQLQHFRTWWRIGVLQFLANVGRHRDFDRQAGQVRLPRDDNVMRAEFHFLEGMVEEHTARTTRAVRTTSNQGMTSQRYTPAGGRPESPLRVLALMLESAEKSYRRALEAVPAHEEARLRFGRVALDLRRPGDALTRLTPLLRTPCAAVTCGLAALFVGEAHDVRGDLADAATAYARASSVTEIRQSALVALAQLAVRRGDARAGAGLIGHFASGTPLSEQQGPDAWSIYLGGRRQNIGAVLEPLRGAILP